MNNFKVHKFNSWLIITIFETMECQKIVLCTNYDNTKLFVSCKSHKFVHLDICGHINRNYVLVRLLRFSKSWIVKKKIVY